eukprot:10800746-Alexandrium_andersonii.AAC.1
MARSDARITEHLGQRAQASVEAVAAPVPRSAEGTAAAFSSGSRPAPEEPEGRPEPAFAGVGLVGAEARAVDTSAQTSDVGEQEVPEMNTDDIDEEMSFLMNFMETEGA